ncbi:MAG: hypothetical protein LBP59_01265 [Planctomycetaceae bacterium]|jgi:acyl carrier protein|nr:hypothetical protein [Planctomycetaceae bacterium]
MTKHEFIQELEFVLNTEAGMLTEDTVLSSVSGWDSTGMLGVIAIYDDLGLAIPVTEIRESSRVADLIDLAGSAIR